MKNTTFVRKIPNGSVIRARYLVNHCFKGMSVSRPPIFIVGCGHSGTTLLRQVLGAHSKIYDIPYESRFCFDEKPERQIACFNRLTVCEGKTRWVEKTPRHIHCIPQLLERFPDGRILIILRDGRDVACSIRDRKGSIQQGILRWIEDNLAGEKYWNHPNVHVLKYEDLIDDFETTMRAVTDFIGEEYEPAMRDYHTRADNEGSSIGKPESVSGRDHDLLRRWQMSQPLFDGRGKWKRMTDEEKRIVWERAGEMLVRYGYADPGWCEPAIGRNAHELVSSLP